ncbi:hypothetical protein L3Q82_001163 [Scortum barcoo]|uniref:Uncharacterized protein n=1 Tax=Scortum barcoo TaxID=214431 RepID=A0ACB8WB74_9TELE|nr:hypothetical protein L3Q82_001163 [Scortum barcoo]
MLHQVILLLASGCVTLSPQIHREYFLINKAMQWEDAQAYCRENHVDLATIGSHDDMKRLVDMTAVSDLTGSIWIGLKKSDLVSWLWSVGETQTGQGVAEYTNWASLPDSAHDCGGMRPDGKWLSALCNTTLPFVCQADEGSSGVHVVLEEMSWKTAQEYCRLNYRDLATVENLTENQALQQIINERLQSPSLVWIGLFKDDWKWSDQSNSSFRCWDSSQPNGDGSCTLYYAFDNAWYDRDCTSEFPFYCYEVKKWRQVVQMEVKLDSCCNFTDSAVSKAILNQLYKKLEGVKLEWRVHPDGKIFHKKEKKKMTEPVENKTLLCAP